MLNLDYCSSYHGAGYHMVDPSFHCSIPGNMLGFDQQNNISGVSAMNPHSYHSYNVVENVNNCKNVNITRPLNAQELRIKQRLENWRFFQARKLGQSETSVLHDIFIDSIVRSASQIKTFDDFFRVAYYWKLVDQYGLEAFDAIRDELEVSKRQRSDYDGPSVKRHRY